MRVPAGELRFEFVRASGPGGQNVNKVATAVRLRFDARGSTSLSPEVAERLIRLAGKRATAEGEVILLGQRHRTQEANRADVIARLERLLEKAEVAPKVRHATRPSKAARQRRLEAKKRRGRAKRDRSRPSESGPGST